MRIERVEPSKHKKNRILVFLEGGQLLKITGNELLHHDLRPGAELSEETVEELQKSAQASQMKARGAQLTGSRMLSKKQVVEHLTRRGGDREAAEDTALWLEELGAVDEAAYGDAKPEELVDAIVRALKETYARRAKAVADTVRPVMQRIYEDRKEQMDSNIYFPLTDGHLGYNIPVNLQKCKDTDGAEIYKVFSKVVMFTTIDDAWREHLREMDDLRQSVQNATYEQKDPLLIYKFESFGLFSKMLEKINRDVLSTLNKAYIPVREQNAEAVQRERQERAKVDVNKLQASRMQAAAQAGQGERGPTAPIHVEKKVGRNDPCPCGSGKKFKNCHGKGL